ncbi:MAG: GNAT family N-acetyltransferase [Bacillota bacterium]
MQQQIRQAGLEDIDELSQVHIESWKAAYKHFLPAEVFDWVTPEKWAERLKESIEDSSAEIAVLTDGNKIIGSITACACRDEDYESAGELCEFYLRPGYWRQGLGTKLVNWSLQRLKEKGFNRVTLWVFEESHGSRKFYERLGFREEGTVRSTRIDESIRVIRYIKDLS